MHAGLLAGGQPQLAHAPLQQAGGPSPNRESMCRDHRAAVADDDHLCKQAWCILGTCILAYPETLYLCVSGPCILTSCISYEQESLHLEYPMTLCVQSSIFLYLAYLGILYT